MNRNEERFDQMMKHRARREDCPLPQGYEQRLDRRLEELPQAGPRRFGRRRLLTAAALLLTACTGAAMLTLKQGTVHFFDSEEAIMEAAAAAAQSRGENVAGYSTYGGADYGDLSPVTEFVEISWRVGERETLTTEARGSAADGWTEMRTVQYEEDGSTFQDTRYLGGTLSDFQSLWPEKFWDVSLLESRYEAVPGTCMYMDRKNLSRETADYISIICEYRGGRDTVFNLQYEYTPGIEWGDSYELTAGYDVAEQYETADGVTVAITMAPSHTGKSMFWVQLFSGHARFSMCGTQLDLEEIKELADHLDLSALAELAVKD